MCGTCCSDTMRQVIAQFRRRTANRESACTAGSHSPTLSFKLSNPAVLLQIGYVTLKKVHWPEPQLFLLTLHAVTDKKPEMCLHLPGGLLLQQGLHGQIASSVSPFLSCQPSSHCLSLSVSLSLGSFGSHWNVEPLSPVGRPSLLPAHCPRRAHRAGTGVLAHFPRRHH